MNWMVLFWLMTSNNRLTDMMFDTIWLKTLSFDNNNGVGLDKEIHKIQIYTIGFIHMVITCDLIVGIRFVCAVSFDKRGGNWLPFEPSGRALEWMSSANRNLMSLRWLSTFKLHTMDLLWEKFQWFLPLYMKLISFQSKTSVVCSVTAAIFVVFCLKKLNVFSQHMGKKTKWISEFCRTSHQELKCWSTFCVNYFLRYYLMMQPQPIVKRVNGMHEWAHRTYQLLSDPYHCCLYKHRQQDERQPL